MKRHCMVLVGLLCAALSAPAFGEEVTDKQLLQAFDDYMAALSGGEFEKLAQYIHPGELEEFKKLFITLGEGANREGNFEALGEIFGVKTLAELRALPPEKMLNNLFVMLTRIAPEFKEVLESAKITLLGQVTEGKGEDKILHLVFRMKMEINGAKVNAVDTVAMKKAADDKYYFLLGEEIQGLITAFRNQFGEVN